MILALDILESRYEYISKELESTDHWIKYISDTLREAKDKKSTLTKQKEELEEAIKKLKNDKES